MFLTCPICKTEVNYKDKFKKISKKLSKFVCECGSLSYYENGSVIFEHGKFYFMKTYWNHENVTYSYINEFGYSQIENLHYNGNIDIYQLIQNKINIAIILDK
jgi:hypothetical protein